MEAVLDILKIFLKISIWSTVIIAFIATLTVIFSAVLIGINGTVIMDIYYMVQMWLPFNLNVILGWCVILIGAFLTYRIASWVFSYVNQLLNSNRSV